MRQTAWLVCLLMTGMVTQAQDKRIEKATYAQVRTVEEFDEIEISGAIELYISQAPERKVVVTARDQADADKIETIVEGGRLLIRFKENKSWWSNQWNTMGRTIRCYVSTPEIREIATAGSGSIRIEGQLKTENLALEVSGSGNLVGNIEVENLKVDQSGSSNIRLTGRARTADFDCSGSGNIASPELSMEQCTVSMSGSGNAELTVTREISAEISGSGNVRYRGEATVGHVSVEGSGKLRKL